MAINLDDRYPGRAGPKNLAYPQGSFKNRTSPTSKDGTYLEKDWANDWAGFFQALLSDAGMTANGVVDTAQASQYFDALMAAVGNRFAPTATFAEVDALVADQGPIIVTDMGCMPWTWVSTAYFTGYRNPLCATIPQHFAATARAWEMPVTGGVWSESDPKQARLIAWFREQGLTVSSGSWAKGWGRIADLGGGDWKAPDLQDVFLRMAGTDADTANPAGPGQYQADAFQGFRMELRNMGGGGSMREAATSGTGSNSIYVEAGLAANRFQAYSFISDGTHGTPRISMETRSAASRVLPVVLI